MSEEHETPEAGTPEPTAGGSVLESPRLQAAAHRCETAFPTLEDLRLQKFVQWAATAVDAPMETRGARSLADGLHAQFHGPPIDDAMVDAMHALRHRRGVAELVDQLVDRLAESATRDLAGDITSQVLGDVARGTELEFLAAENVRETELLLLLEWIRDWRLLER